MNCNAKVGRLASPPRGLRVPPDFGTVHKTNSGCPVVFQDRPATYRDLVVAATNHLQTTHQTLISRADSESRSGQPHHKESTMHQIIYIVGAIVIVLALLSFVGLN